MDPEQQQDQLPTESSVPSLPQLASTDSSGGSLGDVVGNAGNRALAEMEVRVKEKVSSIQSQASELQELEARLQAAERKRAELEAKGIKI